MKKIIILCLAVILMYVLDEKVQGSTYHHFETIEILDGKLLEDFSDKDYKTYYKEVNQRKFMGWRVYKAHTNEKVTFTSETLFSYYNDGYTPIDYSYKLSRTETSKFAVSATGSIGLTSGKDGKGFKHNLTGNLKLSVDYQEVKEDTETIDIKLKVDPGTQVDLYIYGEGKVTNGVAARYVFFIRADRGGFEVFIVTTQFQRLEKRKI